MKLQNKDIMSVLIVLEVREKDEPHTPISGLLHEDIPLSLKRGLQKIRTAVLNKYNECMQDLMEIQASIDKKILAELPEGSDLNEYKKAKEGEKFEQYQSLKQKYEPMRQSEINALDEETFEVGHDYVSLTMIGLIKTKHNYDFDVIEKIAQ